MSSHTKETGALEAVAIIGMAGRFPGAKSVHEFWENLKAGIDSITYFSDDELAASGIDISSIKGNSNYVRAAGILDDVELFDAAFFNMNPKEAEFTDPQHRILMEISWEALEDAGYDPEQHGGAIGVYAGKAKNTYLYYNLSQYWSTGKGADDILIVIGNEPDYMTTRLSYKLNLKGPSVCIHTACSTSLVAVYYACQALLNYECDMALSGGVCVLLPQKQGHWYHEGHFSSPDGRTRSFDAKGEGTLFSNGAGMVVLKRLSEAFADGDTIYAVIKGIAVNNDGADKVGFMAPSVSGQTEVIAMAMAEARVEPGMISYVEGHGTATPLGDPIEVEALTQAFRTGNSARGFCGLGSVKSNIGHLDAAAGVAGLIKTALSLKHRLLPPTIHFEKPNPKFAIEDTPFYINSTLRPWASEKSRIAGVSSFGVGGTNAHAILEEAPDAPPSDRTAKTRLLILSAKTKTALETATDNLIDYFNKNPECTMGDVVFTLQAGRGSFLFRRMLVCHNAGDAVDALKSRNSKRLFTKKIKRKNRPVAFMFPGQGSQYVNMGLYLYQHEDVFRTSFDTCADILNPLLRCDIRTIVFPVNTDIEEARHNLKQTSFTQPVLFSIEYALAQLWMHWGIQPHTMIGHSLGEYVSACLAGVLSIEDALRLLAFRGRLIQDLPQGSMLAVLLPEKQLIPLMPQEISLAAVNSPAACVVSGSHDAIEGIERTLKQKNIACQRLQTSHAFHSAMLDPILEAFERELEKIHFSPPEKEYISCLTGTRITPEQACAPRYWVKQMRETVRFFDGVKEISRNPELVLLESGPGSTLCNLSQKSGCINAEEQPAISSLSPYNTQEKEMESILSAVGHLWLAGVSVNWNSLYASEHRSRIHLPTYPFERKRHWINPPTRQPGIVCGSGDSFTDRDAAPEGGTAAIEKTIISNKERQMVENQKSLRRENIMNKLKQIVCDLGGLSQDEIDIEASFMELGFDSLFLTQASTSFKKELNVQVTFRQLLEDTPSLSTLADYLETHLPENAFVPAPPADAPAAEVQKMQQAPLVFQQSPLIKPESIDGPRLIQGSLNIENLIQQQIQLMNRQLSMLQQVPLSQNLPAISADQEAGHVPYIQPPRPASFPGNETEEKSATEKIPGTQKRFGPWRPFDRNETTTITSKQKKYLDDLIARYTAKTKTSKEMTQRNRPHFADPRTASGFNREWKEMVYPIVAVRSSGSRIWDIDGNEYTDIQSGFGSVFFGHNPDFIREEVEKQLKAGVQIGPQSPVAGDVAKSICELTGMDRVTFCNTGSEAVMAAIRVARTVTGNSLIAMFSHDYHGIFDEVLVRSANIGGQNRSVPVSPGIPSQKVANVLVLEYGDPESIRILREKERDLAAVLVEPVQSRNPDLQPKDFLLQLREFTKKANIPLVFDEVITGFRLHPGGAQAWYGIQSDMATYGKVIGGGMPMGVLAGRKQFMDALDGGMWSYGDSSFPEVGVTYFAGTFVRHPLAIAAASAVVKKLKASGTALHDQLNAKSALLANTLNEHFKKTCAPIHLQRCGSMILVEFKVESKFSSLLFYCLREKGVHILDGGAFFLTTAHTDEDLAVVSKAFRESVQELQLAELLPVMSPQAGTAGGEKIEPGRFPLTDSQTEIWYAAQMGDDVSCAYNESDTVRLRGNVNIALLQQAFQEVFERHEALRITFSADGKYQLPVPAYKIDIPVHDLSMLPEARRDEEAARIISNEAASPFDLVRGPLIRPRILKLAENDFILVYYVHHIVCDGWSAGVLLHELSSIYSVLCQGCPGTLPEPVPFSRYVAEEKNEANAADAHAALQYWIERLYAPLPILELPTDRPRPAVRTYNGNTRKWFLSSALYRPLKMFAASQNATLFAVLLAAFKVLLFRLSGQDDIIVGINVAGQAMSGLENLIGHCVKLLPLRSQLAGDESFASFLKQVRGNVIDAYDHHQTTFGTILQNVKIDRDPSRAPLIEIIFNLSGERKDLQFHGLQATIQENPRSSVHVDMFLNVMESEEKLVIDWDYNSDMFDKETIERWIGNFEILLAGIISDAGQNLSNLPILSQQERDKLLVQWNDDPVN